MYSLTDVFPGCPDDYFRSGQPGDLYGDAPYSLVNSPHSQLPRLPNHDNS